jgi:hypothetical protein
MLLCQVKVLAPSLPAGSHVHHQSPPRLSLPINLLFFHLKFTEILMCGATLHQLQSSVLAQKLKFCVSGGTEATRSASLCGD